MSGLTFGILFTLMGSLLLGFSEKHTKIFTVVIGIPSTILILLSLPLLISVISLEIIQRAPDINWSFIQWFYKSFVLKLPVYMQNKLNMTTMFITVIIYGGSLLFISSRASTLYLANIYRSMSGNDFMELTTKIRIVIALLFLLLGTVFMLIPALYNEFITI
jgi:hypothetical protein